MSRAQGKLTLRLANGLNPGQARSRACDLFAKRVEELTKGEATVQVYHSGVLGSEGQVAEGLQTGTVDFGAIVLFTNAVKLGHVSRYALPLPRHRALEASRRRAAGHGRGRHRARRSDSGSSATGSAAGVTSMAPSRSTTSADLKGLKIRTLQTRMYVELFKAFGAIPTPIAWPETYLALLQKTVDAGETALTSMYDGKHYEVAKHAAFTHHALSSVAHCCAPSSGGSPCPSTSGRP